MKESDLYVPVKGWLESIGCEGVYGEVLNVDVLGIMGKLDIIVEMKTSLNFKVIQQGLDRYSYGSYVYLAVPYPKRAHEQVAIGLLKSKGLGLLYVRENGKVVVKVQAKLNRMPKWKRRRIRRYIKDYHAEQIGGVKGGESESVYKITIRGIKRYLKDESLRRGIRGEDSWLTIDEILAHCETHYKNPKPALAATLKESWNEDWVETKVEKRKRYYRYRQ